ncbi:hypothetical protein GCM10018780_76190 [Streptomyces lanatus]|nr:hypothetical protein GCM10018780_76190 [Streptomyces lanatus]
MLGRRLSSERVLERMSERLAEERASAGQVGDRVVMMIPHRTSSVAETLLPPDDQRILAAVREVTGRPVMARRVGEVRGWTYLDGAGARGSPTAAVCMCRSGIWSSRRRARH